MHVPTTGHPRRQLELPSGRVLPLAGDPSLAGLADGPAYAAAFLRPSALAAAGGALFVADTGNGRLRRVGLPPAPQSSPPPNSRAYTHAHTACIALCYNTKKHALEC